MLRQQLRYYADKRSSLCDTRVLTYEFRRKNRGKERRGKRVCFAEFSRIDGVLPTVCNVQMSRFSVSSRTNRPIGR